MVIFPRLHCAFTFPVLPCFRDHGYAEQLSADYPRSALLSVAEKAESYFTGSLDIRRDRSRLRSNEATEIMIR